MAKYELDIYENGELKEQLKAEFIPWTLTKFCMKLYKTKDVEKYTDHEDELIEEMITKLFPKLSKEDFTKYQVNSQQVVKIISDIMALASQGFSDIAKEKN